MKTNFPINITPELVFLLVIFAAFSLVFYFILKSAKESNETLFLRCIGFSERFDQLLFQLQACDDDEHLESLHTKISSFEKDYKGKVPSQTLSPYLKQLYHAYHRNKYKMGKTITTAYGCTEEG